MFEIPSDQDDSNVAPGADSAGKQQSDNAQQIV